MVGQGLSGRCGLVVANKADLAEGRANLPRLKEEAATLGLRIVGAVRADRLQRRLFSLGCVSNTSARCAAEREARRQPGEGCGGDAWAVQGGGAAKAPA